MKLADVRKLTIRRSVRVRFQLPNGMECVLNEHGIAQVPALESVPDFNLEESFARAQEFLLEPAAAGTRSPAQRVSREELAVLAAAGPAGEPGHDDHEE